MSDEKFQFACQCGAVLTARASQVGRKGQCQRCQLVLEIPDPATVAGKSFTTENAVEIQEVCSVCQTGIDDDDERTACQACGLPFHSECWQENLGCSAYGCKNVNALKVGPDISIQGLGPPTTTPQASPLMQPGPTMQPGGTWSPQRLQRTKQRPVEADVPWEYVVLAASALAALFSIVTCGFPSLLMGVLALVMGVNRSHKIGWAVPVAATAISVLGVLFGFCLSLLYWMV